MSSSFTPIRVFFNKFWPGFIEKTDIMDCSFFVQLLEKTYNAPILVVQTPNDATILVESIFGSYSYLNYKKWRATILFTGESDYANTPNVDKYDCVLGFEHTHSNFVKCPLFVIFLITNPHIMKELEKVDRPIPTPDEIPPNFASIILSNAYHGKERLAFYNTVKKEIPVFSGGKHDNNVGFVVPGSYNSNEMVTFYKRGKFAITMENNDKPYYVTEKLINGIRSGVIPIYWGTSRVTEFFNPNHEVKGIIERMKTMTNDEFINIIREPVLIRPIGEICDEILDSVKKRLT
jgi:hypothetical protein